MEDNYRIMLKHAYDYRDRQNMLIECAQKIAFLADINEIMPEVINSAIKLTDSAIGAAALYNRSNVVFSSYRTKERRLPIEFNFKRGMGISGILMETKKPYVCNGTENHREIPREIHDDLKIENFVSIPLLNAAGEFLGFFEVYNKRDFIPFNEIDVELLEKLSVFASAAVSHSSMLNEIEKFSAELEALVGELQK